MFPSELYCHSNALILGDYHFSICKYALLKSYQKVWRKRNFQCRIRKRYSAHLLFSWKIIGRHVYNHHPESHTEAEKAHQTLSLTTISDTHLTTLNIQKSSAVRRLLLIKSVFIIVILSVKRENLSRICSLAMWFHSSFQPLLITSTFKTSS